MIEQKRNRSNSNLSEKGVDNVLEIQKTNSQAIELMIEENIELRKENTNLILQINNLEKINEYNRKSSRINCYNCILIIVISLLLIIFFINRILFSFEMFLSVNNY